MHLNIKAVIIGTTLLVASQAFSQTSHPSSRHARGAKGAESIEKTCRRLSNAIIPRGTAKRAVRIAQVESCIRNGGRM